MQAKLFHLHALSALHCGIGQSADIVDLPIARARATKLPIVPGSSLRGVLRQLVASASPEDARTLFGPENISSDQDSFAGALSIGDANLLALPVRCLAGIVSYVTSPFILRRYACDLERVGAALPALPNEPTANGAVVSSGSVNIVNEKLVLEDLDLPVQRNEALERCAEAIAKAVHPSDPESQKDFVARFALVPDNILDFLAETATEIRTRIALDPDTGTVRKGALWYEENLPAETLLWGMFALSTSNNRDDPRSESDLREAMPGTDTLLQLGGKAGVGRGLVRFLT